MSSPATAWEDPGSSAAADGPDPAVLRAERRLRLLEELAEIGMDLARSLRPGVPADWAAQATASEAPVAEAVRGKGRDPADAFGPLSRAIRLTLALEATTDAELRDLRAGVVRARAEERAQGAERLRAAAAKERSDRIEEIRDLVIDVAGSQIDCEHQDAFNDLEEELEERLSEHQAEFASPDRPLRETVEGLCKAMGLSPDWSRWNGCGWGPEGEPFRPFVSALRPPTAGLAEAASPPPPPPAPPNPLPPWRRELAHDLE